MKVDIMYITVSSCIAVMAIGSSTLLYRMWPDVDVAAEAVPEGQVQASVRATVSVHQV